MKDFLLNKLAPFLRNRGWVVVLVLAAVIGTALLLSNARTGPMPSPWKDTK